MVRVKQWILASAFEGEPKASNFKLVEENIPDTLKDGEILCEAVYLSVDPYMRLFPIKVNEVMIGEQIAKVTASKNSKYPVGSMILSRCGWRSHTILNEDAGIRMMPPVGKQPQSVGLGIMGMPGATAYFGFLDLCKPKAGNVVLVNGAAGAVGSAVGQIAKIKGCKVIGFAGSKEKCDWLKELGFDHVFNYKEVNVDEALKQAAPDGIDCYFDNVGGDFTSTALNHMKRYGKISVCGNISMYNDLMKKVTNPFVLVIMKELTITGFIVQTWFDKWPGAFKEILQWIEQGKLKYKETVTEGFENLPQAFMSLFKGGNIGKAVVKV